MVIQAKSVILGLNYRCIDYVFANAIQVFLSISQKKNIADNKKMEIMDLTNII
jgi:hypothetical protein